MPRRRSLDGGLHEASLDLVAVDARRELEFGVEWMNTPPCRSSIAHARDRHRAEQGDEAPRVEAPVRESDEGALRGALGAREAQGVPDVPIATSVDVSLQQEPEQLAPLPLGLTLDAR